MPARARSHFHAIERGARSIGDRTDVVKCARKPEFQLSERQCLNSMLVSLAKEDLLAGDFHLFQCAHISRDRPTVPAALSTVRDETLVVSSVL
jgi:hypothetical protein